MLSVSIMPGGGGLSSLLKIAVFLDGVAFVQFSQYFQVLINLDPSFSIPVLFLICKVIRYPKCLASTFVAFDARGLTHHSRDGGDATSFGPHAFEDLS
ncbi:hypothetical protein [Burkholderia sp. F1]|uniref:hypothetical protein n=1 Tax=Burkholderia sp. F1 TaxID=3366817 RepID=UPI003D704D7F